VNRQDVKDAKILGGKLFFAYLAVSRFNHLLT